MIAPPRKPSHDELEALIKEARARQLRRRLLGATGVAITAAVGLASYALTMSGGPRNMPQSPTEGIGAGNGRCRPAQLSANVGFQPATQSAVGGADLRNISDHACSLPTTWPRVRLTSGGKLFLVDQRRPAGSRSKPPVHVLAPGQTAVVEMQWLNFCGTPHMPVRNGGEPLAAISVTFALRFGAGLVVTAAETGTPPCFAPRDPSTLIVDRARQWS